MPPPIHQPHIGDRIMERTDIPMDGIHRVQKDLETLDTILSTQPQEFRPEFIRTIVIGILAKLDAAIVEINES